MCFDSLDVAKIQRKLSEFFGVEFGFSIQKIFGVGVGGGVVKGKFLGIGVGVGVAKGNFSESESGFGVKIFDSAGLYS